MRHITPARLAAIEPLLERIRLLDGLLEKKTGIFYRKSRAFLHFHEQGDEIFADVRLDGVEFSRLPSTSKGQQEALVVGIEKSLRRV